MLFILNVWLGLWLLTFVVVDVFGVPERANNVKIIILDGKGTFTRQNSTPTRPRNNSDRGRFYSDTSRINFDTLRFYSDKTRFSPESTAMQQVSSLIFRIFVYLVSCLSTRASALPKTFLNVFWSQNHERITKQRISKSVKFFALIVSRAILSCIACFVENGCVVEMSMI